MTKTKTALEAPETVTQLLAKIKKNMDAAHNLKVGSVKLGISESDIYLYELHLPDYEHKIYLNLHGRCKEEGLAKYPNHVAVQTGHIPTSDKIRARTRCQHCNEQLDPVHSAVLEENRLARLVDINAKFHAAQKEKMLLGLI